MKRNGKNPKRKYFVCLRRNIEFKRKFLNKNEIFRRFFFCFCFSVQIRIEMETLLAIAKRVCCNQKGANGNKPDIFQ